MIINALMLQDLIGQMVSPPILFFALGVFAALLKSDLKIPDAAGTILSVIILASIGLRAGVAVHAVGISNVILPAAAAILVGVFIVLVVFNILKKLTKIDSANAASIAGHYGAVSSVTLAVSILFLDNLKVHYEPFVPALYPFMDTAALLTAVVLSRISVSSKKTTDQVSYGHLLRDTVVSKGPLLLLGCFVIGFINGEAGTTRIMPVFDVMFPGLLAVFMLDVGLIAGARLYQLLTVDKKVFIIGLLLPPIHGIIGVIVASLIGLSPGGATIFAAIAGGASYISAPAVMRAAVPDANPSLSLAMALGLAFPFNVTIGIPIYYQTALMVERFL
ncbi:MAG TPA: sodium-dependent bicarbonate transport family permease [Bacteroidales bacterium]|nr:sodium-dependent bicarbonate transport family permease [Bacteroidales bacterium]